MAIGPLRTTVYPDLDSNNIAVRSSALAVLHYIHPEKQHTGRYLTKHRWPALLACSIQIPCVHLLQYTSTKEPSTLSAGIPFLILLLVVTLVQRLNIAYLRPRPQLTDLL